MFIGCRLFGGGCWSGACKPYALEVVLLDEIGRDGRLARADPWAMSAGSGGLWGLLASAQPYEHVSGYLTSSRLPAAASKFQQYGMRCVQTSGSAGLARCGLTRRAASPPLHDTQNAAHHTSSYSQGETDEITCSLPDHSVKGRSFLRVWPDVSPPVSSAL
jgi:hypothetical protein